VVPTPHYAPTPGGQAKELDLQDGAQIDIGQELARLKRTLADAQRRLIFRAEVATVKNVRKLVGGAVVCLEVLAQIQGISQRIII
jgi:hypothetical protein